MTDQLPLTVDEKVLPPAQTDRFTDSLNSDRAEWFRAKLLGWWGKNFRDFPWRQTKDPYRILIAELMLRRTQAKQVEPVYERFIFQYPNVRALATAEIAELARLLYPLGLAWRVDAFREAAIQILLAHVGDIPRDRKALLSLPGIGDYVADAVLCFAFDKPVAIVDTNTVRVSGRFVGFPYGGNARRLILVRTTIAKLAGGHETRSINLAMLDLAALVCRARGPRCGECPVSDLCHFFNSNNAIQSKHPPPR